MGVDLKGRLNQSVPETREISVVFISDFAQHIEISFYKLHTMAFHSLISVFD